MRSTRSRTCSVSPRSLRVHQARRCTRIRHADTDTLVPMTAADQVWFSGRTPAAPCSPATTGARGAGPILMGDILGAEGEIRVTAPTGNVQVQALTISGGRGDDTDLQELPVPASYRCVEGIDPIRQSPAFIVAHSYDQVLVDIRDETSVVPSW
jgi:hypothetical protein